MAYSKKFKLASCKKHSGTKLDQCQSRVFEGLSFSVYAIFSKSPWRPSLIVHLHKFDIFQFRDHSDQTWSKYIHVF